MLRAWMGGFSVVVNGMKPIWCPEASWVTGVSVLDPVLFNIFINYMDSGAM